MPERVADAVRGEMLAGLGNRGTTTEAERRTEAVVADARSAVGDLLGRSAPLSGGPLLHGAVLDVNGASYLR